MLFRVRYFIGLVGLIGRCFTGFIGGVGLVALAGAGGCDCNGGGFTVDAAPSDAPMLGSVTLAWSITDLNNVPLACDQVGATTVFLQLRNRFGGTGAVVSLSCASGTGMSQPIAPGTYDVTIELHAGADTIATAPAQNGVVIRSSLDAQLTSVTFKLDANGRLVLSIAAPPATSNCQPTAAGGAGITTNMITLVHTGDGCAPVTFTRTRGTTTLGTYVVSCSSPMVTDCIETDERLTVETMPSGSYTIQILGRFNALTCWQNNDTFQVPALGKTLDERRNLAFQDNVAGCVQP